LADSKSLLRLWTHECSKVFRDRLIDEIDRNWYDHKIIEVLENDFGKAWTADMFVDVVWGDFLQGPGGSYVEVTGMQFTATLFLYLWLQLTLYMAVNDSTYGLNLYGCNRRLTCNSQRIYFFICLCN